MMQWVSRPWVDQNIAPLITDQFYVFLMIEPAQWRNGFNLAYEGIADTLPHRGAYVCQVISTPTETMLKGNPQQTFLLTEDTIYHESLHPLEFVSGIFDSSVVHYKEGSQLTRAMGILAPQASQRLTHGVPTVVSPATRTWALQA
jgi:hypothetical protein